MTMEQESCSRVSTMSSTATGITTLNETVPCTASTSAHSQDDIVRLLFQSKLDDVDFRRICNFKDIESLVTYVKQLQQEYQQTRIHELHQLNSSIRHFHTYNAGFKVLDPPNMSTTSAIWGSVQLCIELVRQANEVFQMIVDMFGEIGTTLPRIHIYEQSLGGDISTIRELRDSCRKVNLLIAEFSCLVIIFYRKHPLKNMLKITWQPFKSDFQLLSDKFFKISRHIERQAQALAFKNLLASETLRPQAKLPCHYISRPRHCGLLHRGEVLNAIDDALNPRRQLHDPTQQKVFSLTGLGGVGKTQIALEYIYTHLNDYPAIFWISAENGTTVAQGIREATLKLGLVSQNSAHSDQSMTRFFSNWLQDTSENWLICFDNADELKVIGDYWPVTNHGSVLITSRDPSSTRIIRSNPRHSQGQQVSPFSDRDGAILIISLIYGEAQEGMGWDVLQGEDSEDSKEQKEAEAISKELGGLPLALNQAANYILETGCSLGTLLSILSDPQEKIDLLGVVAPVFDLSYSHSLSTVWEISRARLGQDSKHLLELLAHLDRDSIPESLLQCQNAEWISPTWKGLRYLKRTTRYLQAVRGLFAQSFIGRNKSGDAFVMHRLVGTMTLLRMHPDDRQSRFDEAVELIYQKYPRLGRETTYLTDHWAVLRLYLPQVTALECQYRESKNSLQPKPHFGSILCSATWFLFEQNSPEQALDLLHTTVDVCEATRTGNEMILAFVYRTYGAIYTDTMDYQAALDNHMKVLQIWLEILPRDDILLSSAYNNIALGYIGVGKYDLAEDNFDKCLLIKERHPHLNPAMRGLTYSNISLLKELQGDYEPALDLARRALLLVEDNYGAQNIKSAECHHRLGNAYIGLIQLDDAIEEHFQALDIGQRLVGDGYRTAASMHKVACILSARERFKEAENFLLKVLRIYEEGYHTRGELGRSSYLMATVLARLGRDQESKDMKAFAAQIRKEVLGLEPDENDNQDSYDLMISFLIR